MFKTLTRKLSNFGTFSSTSSSSSSSGEATSNTDLVNKTTTLSSTSSFYQSNEAKFRVVAFHDYVPLNEETDLALYKGEQYEILDSSGVWWVARDAWGQIGLIPYNYIQMMISIQPPIPPLHYNRSSVHKGCGRFNINKHNQLVPSTFHDHCLCQDEKFGNMNVEYMREDNFNDKTAENIQFQNEYYDTEMDVPPPLPPHHLQSLNANSSNTLASKTNLQILSLFQHQWFFSIDRETAEQLLKQACNPNGSFLVRPSISENNCFTLSILINKNQIFEVKHYLIQHQKSSHHNVFFIRPQEKFLSIEKLIEYYRKNRGHLVTQLTQIPCRANFIWQKSSIGYQQKQGYNHHHQAQHHQLTNIKEQSSRSNDVTRDIFTDRNWEIKVSELQLLEELGSGQFGVVRHGKWKGKYDVAVKLMKEGTMSERDFIEEAKVMTKLQHQNLVKLYCICIEHRPICIVSEFMKHGSLLSFLRKNEQKILDSSQKVRFLLNICIQVASGMAYLEMHNYIHRDLAARNCLVGDYNVVKVADFGLTRYVIDDEYTSSSGTKFPIRWASPEVLWFSRFSSKSDVWAYGILIWEVFSLGKLPYGKFTNAEVVDKIREGYRLDKPKKWCPSEIFQMMKICWHELPERRPSFQKLERCLIELKEQDLEKKEN